MKRPKGLSCNQCEHYWWYVGSCNIYGGIIKDTENNKCYRFIIKTKSEDPWYDPLPTSEQLKFYSLRVCYKCGLEAKTEDDLKLFKKDKRGLFGRGAICNKCVNKYILKRREKNGYAYIETKNKRKIMGGWKEPFLCYFCGKPIIKYNGVKPDCLAIHSLDGNHNNWNPENKVPIHGGCHTIYHNTNRKYPPKTEEQKEKIRKTLTGRKLSESHIENIRKSHIGDKCYKWKGDNAKPESIRVRKWKEKKRLEKNNLTII